MIPSTAFSTSYFLTKHQATLVLYTVFTTIECFGMSDLLSRSTDLPPDYYLSNFSFLLDWVWARYSDLLNDNERFFVQSFKQLDRDAQCLLVRLSSRKGPLFRRDKLHYPEIESIDIAAQKLMDSGLLLGDTPLQLSEVVNALTKVELLTLFSDQLIGMKQSRKEEIIGELSSLFSEPKNWMEWTSNKFGKAYYLNNQPIISNLLLLFFGNAYQNLTEFVLQDLGLFQYETYAIDHQHRIFKSRNELEQYQQLIQLRELIETEASVDSLTQIAANLPQVCVSENLQRRWDKLSNHLAYRLERSGEHLLAMQLYKQSNLPPARERLIRLFEKQENFSEAWNLLNELLVNPQDEQELQVALRIAPRLAKKLGRTFEKRISQPIHEQQLTLRQFFDEHGNADRVENIVRLSLNCESAPCIYVENSLLLGLFGLWLWPEIFRGIEGAFANPFQAAPLDMYQENFVAKRPNIAELWTQLENNDYRKKLIKIWEEKFGISNHFVNWSLLTKELLHIALQCIPAAHLKVIFERLLFDIKSNRSGLPDLIQFYPERNSYRMIEVKGPGDRIQDNQARWLAYFAQHEIPVEVCYVRWQ